MVNLQELTEVQAARLEKMKGIIERLQRENTGLKTQKWAHSLGSLQAQAIAGAETARIQAVQDENMKIE